MTINVDTFEVWLEKQDKQLYTFAAYQAIRDYDDYIRNKFKDEENKLK